MMAILLPVLCGFAGLVLDSSLLMADYRNLQHASDGAATEAATALYNVGTAEAATAAAVACVQTENGFTDANVVVNIPPQSGPYAGNANYVEVIASRAENDLLHAGARDLVAAHDSGAVRRRDRGVDRGSGGRRSGSQSAGSDRQPGSLRDAFRDVARPPAGRP